MSQSLALAVHRVEKKLKIEKWYRYSSILERLSIFPPEEGTLLCLNPKGCYNNRPHNPSANVLEVQSG